MVDVLVLGSEFRRGGAQEIPRDSEEILFLGSGSLGGDGLLHLGRALDWSGAGDARGVCGYGGAAEERAGPGQSARREERQMVVLGRVDAALSALVLGLWLGLLGLLALQTLQSGEQLAGRVLCLGSEQTLDEEGVQSLNAHF